MLAALYNTSFIIQNLITLALLMHFDSQLILQTRLILHVDTQLSICKKYLILQTRLFYSFSFFKRDFDARRYPITHLQKYLILQIKLFYSFSSFKRRIIFEF